MIWVSFCCNNPDTGLFTGMVCAVHIHGADINVELDGPNYPDGCNTFSEIEKPASAADRCDRGFKLGRYKFGCYGWKSWYGNWCWEATQMTGVDVLGLLLTLRELRYSCTAGPTDLFDAYNDGAPITPALVQEALR